MTAMPKKKTVPISTPKDRDITDSEKSIVKTDIAELKGLGFVVTRATVPDHAFPSYAFNPPTEKAMYQWRLELEKAGFEVNSSLNRENLGFSVRRKPAQGKGWT